MRVLVVCTANIARSPLAAAMLESSLGRAAIEVLSAGTRARAGYPAAGNTQRLATQRSLDLLHHRSRPITDGLVAGADLCLTMTERHRDHCAVLAAGAGGYTFSLPEFVRLLEAVDLDAGPRDADRRLPWVVEQAHLARPRARPAKATEDVDDPITQPWPAWEQMAATLDSLSARVVDAFGQEPGWRAASPSATADGVRAEELSGRSEGTATRRRGRPWRRSANR